MSSPSTQIDALVQRAFNNQELALLSGYPVFAETMGNVRTLDDYETLCDLGDWLLKEIAMAEWNRRSAAWREQQ